MKTHPKKANKVETARRSSIGVFVRESALITDTVPSFAIRVSALHLIASAMKAEGRTVQLDHERAAPCSENSESFTRFRNGIDGLWAKESSSEVKEHLG